MTEKQERYIKFLANTRIMTSDVRERLFTALANGMSWEQTDKTIKWLLAQPEFPKKSPASVEEVKQEWSDNAARIRLGDQLDARIAGAPRETLPDVREGRYAVEHEGVLKFYRVDKPQDGKWAGRTFVSVQASDDFHPIKSWESKVEILKLIAADPQEALLRYGREIGRCGHCGRTLTNEESRQYGIGPICREGLGW